MDKNTIRREDLATENATYVGFGFIEENFDNGVKFFRAFWFHKATLSPKNEESATKEETIPEFMCKAWPVGPNAELGTYKDFETEAAAVSYLNGLAGVRE